MTKLQGTLFDDLPGYLGHVSKHPAYRVWRCIMTRCYNPNGQDFKAYGGRGIFVCDEWRGSSRAFVAWAIANGRQRGLQLDRENNDGPYSPGNCRFVTPRQNANNRRNTLRVADGTALSDAMRSFGVSRKMVYERLHRGWSPDDAVSIPKGGKRPSATVRFALGESEASAQGDEAQRKGSHDE